MAGTGHGRHGQDGPERSPAVFALVFALQCSFVWRVPSTALAVGMTRTRLRRQRLEAGHFTAAIHANVFLFGIALQKSVLSLAWSQRMPGARHGEQRPLVGKLPSAVLALGHCSDSLVVEGEME